MKVEGEEDEQEEWLWSLDSEIEDYLESKDDSKVIGGAFTPQSRRPNGYGGLHSHPNASSLQPLSNRNHWRSGKESWSLACQTLSQLQFMKASVKWPLAKQKPQERQIVQLLNSKEI